MQIKWAVQWNGYTYCLQIFLLIFKLANQCTKYVIVFLTNKRLVGTLITMGGKTVSIAVPLAKFTNHDTLSHWEKKYRHRFLKFWELPMVSFEFLRLAHSFLVRLWAFHPNIKCLSFATAISQQFPNPCLETLPGNVWNITLCNSLTIISTWHCRTSYYL